MVDHNPQLELSFSAESPDGSGERPVHQGRQHCRAVSTSLLLSLGAWMTVVVADATLMPTHHVGVAPAPMARPTTAISPSLASIPLFRADIEAAVSAVRHVHVVKAAVDDGELMSKSTAGPAAGRSLRSAVTFATAVVALMGAAASFVAWSGHRLELPSLGQLCGASSVVIWLVSQIPQMVKNQRHRKAEDLSIDFLLLWTLGDLCNLAGCFLIEGTITQRVLAVYFVMCNAVLLLQWWNFGQPAEKGGGMSSTSQAFWFAVMGGSALGLARCLVCGLPTVQIGDYLGWVSAGVYLLSRLPQLWRNFVTQKVDDLAPSLFLLAALGNATYAASILAVSLSPDWLRVQAPFLVGSVGTLVFDAALLLQIKMYRRPSEVPSTDSCLVE
eukprot:GGOE01019507.1.p1 GENE.GGOE01019507.1~~GGOE01019507.1.p1  ORF type:complete len:406 (-),score=62.28 GGOE01019507.1:83-1240(-)